MKKTINAILAVSIIFCFIAISGCSAGQGITNAERERQHQRVLDTGVKQLNDDIDSSLHWDRPNRLTEKYTR